MIFFFQRQASLKHAAKRKTARQATKKLSLLLLLFTFIGILILIIALTVTQQKKELSSVSVTDFMHSDFDLTRKEFMTLVENVLDELSVSIPEEDRRKIQRAIEADSKTVLNCMSSMLKTEDQVLFVLVDKTHALLEDYIPGDLHSLNDYPDLTLNRQDLSLRKKIIPDLIAMIKSAEEQNIVLDISSSYRSYAYQKDLFQRHVDQLGLLEAERVSAREGKSQHQLGTTIDFGSITPHFAQEPAGIWLAEEAWRFGFSLSYPDGYEELSGYSYEPWHFRYLGKTAVELQRIAFMNIQQYLLLFYDNAASKFRKHLFN